MTILSHDNIITWQYYRMTILLPYTGGDQIPNGRRYQKTRGESQMVCE